MLVFLGSIGVGGIAVLTVPFSTEITSQCFDPSFHLTHFVGICGKGELMEINGPNVWEFLTPLAPANPVSQTAPTLLLLDQLESERDTLTWSNHWSNIQPKLVKVLSYNIMVYIVIVIVSHTGT